MKPQPGKIIFLIGLASCGKTTTSEKIRELYPDHKIILLDNDTIRKGVNNDIGFSPQGRHENIRRVSEMACVLAAQGFNVICSFTMPARQLREDAKTIIYGHGLEVSIVQLNCPWNLCAERNWKPFFFRDEKGDIKDSTGTNEMFEDGLIDLVLDSSNPASLDYNCHKIALYL